MKKFLLCAAAVLSCAAIQAQNSFQIFYRQGEETGFTRINNGDVIEINQLETVDEEYEYHLTCYFQATNLTSSQITINDFYFTEDTDVTTMEDPHPSFCYMSYDPTAPGGFTGSCLSNWTDHAAVKVAPGASVQGNNFHLALVFANSNPNLTVDLKDPKYAGAWGATLHAKCGSETLEASLVYYLPDDGVEGVGADNNNAPVEYFNLQGVKVANPQGGLYIKRQGHKTSKVIL